MKSNGDSIIISSFPYRIGCLEVSRDVGEFDMKEMV